MRFINSNKREFPRITIITSTLNCASALMKTAFSIREQTYKNIQWIVADGASMDRTIEVVNQNLDIVTNHFSHADSGIYEAWNKACKFIDGDWTLFLGAGDILQASNTIQLCVNKLLTIPEDYNFAFGNIKIQSEHGSYEVQYQGEFNPVWMDLNYSTPPHSAVFTRSSILKNCPFDTRLKIIGDKKFMIQHSNNKYYNLETDVTIMDGLGISHELKNIPLIWNENIMISRDTPKAPLSHKIKAYAANYRNVFMLCLVGERCYKKWVQK